MDEGIVQESPALVVHKPRAFRGIDSNNNQRTFTEISGDAVMWLCVIKKSALPEFVDDLFIEQAQTASFRGPCDSKFFR